jgi:hypothetical protein
MAMFTLTLDEAIEYVGGPDKIGLNDYPIYDPAHRPILNKKIIDRYFNREIGLETVELFTFALKRKMNEIMPMYNDLYETQKLAFDPLLNMNISTTSEGETETEANAETENNTTTTSGSGSRAVTSDTPQVMLSGSGDYASSASDTNSSNTATGTGSDTSTTKANERNNAESVTKGYQGSPSALLMEYRRTIMNIDLMILDELVDLFMSVWDNGDDFAPYNIPNLHL